MAKAKYTKGKDGYWKTRVWDGTHDTFGRKKYITIRWKKSSKDLENKVIEHNRQIKDRKYVVPNDIPFLEYAVKWEDVYIASRAGNTRAIYPVHHTEIPFVPGRRKSGRYKPHTLPDSAE